jgi:RING-type zinc-finger
LASFKSSPPSKHMKSESDVVLSKNETEELESEPEVDAYEDHCTICLQPFVDRTVVPTCSHEFCFECLMIWSGTYPYGRIVTNKKNNPVQINLDDARSVHDTSVTTSFIVSAPLSITRSTSFPPSVRPLVISPPPTEPVLPPYADAVNVCGVHAIVLRKMRLMR